MININKNIEIGKIEESHKIIQRPIIKSLIRLFKKTYLIPSFFLHPPDKKSIFSCFHIKKIIIPLNRIFKKISSNQIEYIIA